jgi:hypothetical protein
MSLDDIRKQIYDAFPAKPYPGVKALTYGLGHDSGTDEVVEYYRGKDWKDIKYERINDHTMDPHELGILVYPYYLPAMMLNALDFLGREGDEAVSFVGMLLGTLTPHAEYPHLFEARMESLNVAQIQVVYAWMKEISVFYEGWYPETATMNFWRILAG